MKHVVLVLATLALTSTALAGCLGDEDLPDSGIPRAVVVVTPQSAGSAIVTFDASGSTGKGLKFEWNFGDGTTDSEPRVTHEYQYGDGTYTASLLITDLNGITDLWEQDITVGSGVNQAPSAAFSLSTRYLEVGQPLTVDASLSEDPEGDPITYFWDFNAFMNEAEYIQFREDKKAGVSGESGDDTQVEDGSNKSAALPGTQPVERLLELGEKDLGHDGHDSAPPVSLFNGKRTSTEPVFTLDSGFPDATRFYVKLIAVDVKGDSTAILSEEVWPVLVVEKRIATYYGDSRDGVFQVGNQATVTDATPDDENVPIDDEEIWTFDLKTDIEHMFVNVTWSASPINDQYANDIDVEIVSPNGIPRADVDPSGEPIAIEMTAEDGLGSGTWTVKIYGRKGVDIQWTATYWAKADQNPFRTLEKAYV